MNLPQKNEIWSHFKGGKYKIVGFAWDAEGDVLVLRVLYQQDIGPIFSRSISNFLMPVGDGVRFERHSG